MTGEELKDCRNKLGFSQERLADSLGMTRNMVGFMERGYAANGRPVSIEHRTSLAVRCLMYEAGVMEVEINDRQQ